MNEKNFTRPRRASNISYGTTSDNDGFKQNRKFNQNFKACNKTTGSVVQQKKNFANKRLQNYRHYLQENKICHKHMLPNQTDTNSDEPTGVQSNSLTNKTSPRKCNTVQYHLKCQSVNLTRNFNSQTDVEEMDWEPVNDDVALLEIQMLRQKVDPQSYLNKTSSFDTEPFGGSYYRNCIVVDTNIFLSCLQVLKDINKMEGSFTILIPWMVIQELDYLKDNNSRQSVQRNARTAITFINRYLSVNDPRLRGQSVSDAFQHKYSSANADDNIIFCCMQAKEKGYQVVLLTNDVNLKNKAFINKIASYNKDEIVLFLGQEVNLGSPTLKTKTNEIKQHLSLLFSYMIVKEMISAYGAVWQNILKTDGSTPLSFEDCVNVLDKYWIAVFSLNLQKQCSKTIKSLKQLFDQGVNIANTSEFNKFKDLVFELCVFFRNAYPVYLAAIEKCVKSIEEVCHGV